MHEPESSTLALSWSGGKDSALALWTLRQCHLRPRVLITTITGAYARVSMHGVRRDLLTQQAYAAGIGLVEVSIPVGCTDELYEHRMAKAWASEKLRNIQTVAFGDLFLQDVRAYREERLAAAGKQGLFPLWHRDTTVLAREFIAAGFEAILVCVDPSTLDPSFAGRPFDAELLADLPPGVDPCGENGEFHTFVHAGPILSNPIAIQAGETVERDGFVFCDLIARDRGD
ncbi:MAG: ATP-binding protein [Solirubrobacteraceae bacterium]